MKTIEWSGGDALQCKGRQQRKTDHDTSATRRATPPRGRTAIFAEAAGGEEARSVPQNRRPRDSQKTGSNSSTATRVAGSEPLKIATTDQSVQPSGPVRSMAFVLRIPICLTRNPGAAMHGLIRFEQTVWVNGGATVVEKEKPASRVGLVMRDDPPADRGRALPPGREAAFVCAASRHRFTSPSRPWSMPMTGWWRRERSCRPGFRLLCGAAGPPPSPWRRQGRRSIARSIRSGSRDNRWKRTTEP